MNSSNQVIQSLWIGDSLSVMERLSLSSFMKHGHEVHLYTYGDVREVPAGVIIKDANEILSQTSFDYRRYPKLAIFSDLFRYKLLFERGGWWVDTDTVCLRPFDFKDEHVISSETTKTGEVHVNNGNLKAPRGSQLMAWLWNIAVSKDPASVQWGETGPRLMKDAVQQLGMSSAIKPPNVFCPLPWWETYKLNDPSEVPTISPDAYALHLWNEQWTYIKDNKLAPKYGSLYAQLIKEYDAQVDFSNVTALVKTFLRDRSLFHCVKTLKASYPSIRILVSDDGHCSTEKGNKLKELGVERYIELPWKRGLSEGRNVLADACQTPYVMLCDDDFSFTTACHLERLRTLTEEVDIAGGLVFNLRHWTFSDEGMGWDVTGGNFVTRNGKMWVDGTRGEVKKYKGIRYEEADFVLNFFIAKTDMIRKLRWDEALIFSAEHVDFCLRAKAQGIKSGRCLDSFVLHKEIDDVYDPDYMRITGEYPKYRDLFEKKWGFPHPEHIPSTIPRGVGEPEPMVTLEAMSAIERARSVLPTPISWEGGFLEKKINTLFQKFRYVVATIPNSAHYKQLCKIYPQHLEEVIDTPEGQRIIFVVEK